MAHEIRRVLQIYDNAAEAPPKIVITVLRDITNKIAKNPQAYDLCADPSDAYLWESAGGNNYSENQEFPSLLGERWMEVLSNPAAKEMGFDKDDWEQLAKDMTGWFGGFDAMGLEFGDQEALAALLAKLKEEAPEPTPDSDDDDDDDSDEE